MHLPRLQLFEFNDTPGVPGFVKDTVIESLSRTLAWGHVLGGLVRPFSELIARAGVTEVLDVGAGAGGPAGIFVDELLAAGVTPPRFILTDVNPQLESWKKLKERHPSYIDYIEAPLDATRVPPELARGRVVAIINALHHFPPALAEQILLASLEDSKGVFVVEGFERTPFGFAAFASAGVPALFANPILAPRENLAKALFTWLTPFALGVSIWDGLVSTMRVYSEEELRAMVASRAPSTTFTYGTYPIGWIGRGYYFVGEK
jgi:hypothetical protein